MNFIWNTTPLANIIIEAVFLSLIFSFLFFVFAKVVKRKAPYIILGSSAILVFISFLFNLYVVLIFAIVLSLFTTYIILSSNIGDLRNFIANPFRTNSTLHKNKKSLGENYPLYVDKISKLMSHLVSNFSSKKIGAIITFERKVSLNEFCKNGIILNAPLNEEILETIFYPGTRLHDGAVIIKNETILAASVFFAPTTKSYSKKYGSRHRAAIGISEVSDSVTVVVSEETGKISIAADGTLERVSKEKFEEVFKSYMNQI